MTNLEISSASPTATAPAAWPIALATAAATNAPAGPRKVPPFIRADEAYYWSFGWQNDVREAMAALAAGDYEEFDSDDPNDAVRWLLAVDDEDHDES
jgi:hypothetical protein